MLGYFIYNMEYYMEIYILKELIYVTTDDVGIYFMTSGSCLAKIRKRKGVK